MDAARSPRRLRGHNSTATCCVSSRDRPNVVATAGEDGCVCLFDLRCKYVQLVVKLGTDAISSLCFKQGHENMIYASSGSEIKCFDLQMPTFEKPMERYAYNKEEINQISCNSKSSFLAAADDSGDVKIIDIQQCRPFKTLRSGHANICSSVQFLPWKPWEVVSGGFDSKMILWDFSKGRSLLVVDFGNGEDRETPGQYYNPAFIHAIAVPETDMLSNLGKACAVARGDGVVSLINLESELDAVKSKPATKAWKNSGMKSRKTTAGAGASALNQNVGKRLHLDYRLGGHTAAASCVIFSSFGERGKFIISGGNDKSVKVWDWSQSLEDRQTCEGTDVAFSINVQKKVKIPSVSNLHKFRPYLLLERLKSPWIWVPFSNFIPLFVSTTEPYPEVNGLCTTSADSENLVVCDTSKVVKVYTIS